MPRDAAPPPFSPHGPNYLPGDLARLISPSPLPAPPPNQTPPVPRSQSAQNAMAPPPSTQRPTQARSTRTSTLLNPQGEPYWVDGSKDWAKDETMTSLSSLELLYQWLEIPDSWAFFKSGKHGGTQKKGAAELVKHLKANYGPQKRSPTAAENKLNAIYTVWQKAYKHEIGTGEGEGGRLIANAAPTDRDQLYAQIQVECESICPDYDRLSDIFAEQEASVRHRGDTMSDMSQMLDDFSSSGTQRERQSTTEDNDSPPATPATVRATPQPVGRSRGASQPAVFGTTRGGGGNQASSQRQSTTVNDALATQASASSSLAESTLSFLAQEEAHREAQHQLELTKAREEESHRSKIRKIEEDKLKVEQTAHRVANTIKLAESMMKND